ncbi:glycosyltransferase family 4 protein [Omnitrophica bacterium]|nr:glycosyltransferase family 4 protein [Candidatus Omnitrophota bacterium]
MKIAYFIASYLSSIGGGDVFTHNIASELAQRGIEATVITPTSRKLKKKVFDYPVIYINPLIAKLLFKFPALGKRWLLYEMDRLQKRHNFSLWQVIGGYPLGTYGVDYLNKKNIPSVLRCMGEDIQKVPEIRYGYRLKPPVDRLIREKYPLFDKIAALTKSVSEELESIQIPRDKITIIPNGIKFERFKEPCDRLSVRDRLGVQAGELLLLTVGRYHSKKGSRYIPVILQRLLERGYKVRWLLVGIEVRRVFEGDLTPDVKERIILRNVDIGLDEKNRLDIPAKELLEYYHAADLLVFPTLIETFGRVLIEAMASGLPLVSTNVAGVKDVVEHTKTGLLSEGGDIEAMVSNIERLSNDKALYGKIKNNGLAKARDFDWSIVADKYIDLYERAIERKKG